METFIRCSVPAIYFLFMTNRRFNCLIYELKSIVPCICRSGIPLKKISQGLNSIPGK